MGRLSLPQRLGYKNIPGWLRISSRNAQEKHSDKESEEKGEGGSDTRKENWGTKVTGIINKLNEEKIQKQDVGMRGTNEAVWRCIIER